jgi:predicted DNA-binding transcriptional regulator AlpA
MQRAHRVAYELTYGPIPEGLDVLHNCDTRPCVRPDHLFLGTQLDNMKDMHRKGRCPSSKGKPRPRYHAVATRSKPKKKTIGRPTDYISQAEAIQILGVSRITLWRWVRGGKINSITLTGRPALLRSEIEALKRKGR